MIKSMISKWIASSISKLVRTQLYKCNYSEKVFEKNVHQVFEIWYLSGICGIKKV
jgi:hypothetical protein